MFRLRRADRSGWRCGGSPSGGRTCARWRCGRGRGRARSSSSRSGSPWAGCSASYPWPRWCGGCCCCRSPCRRAGCGTSEGVPATSKPACNQPLGRRSTRRRSAGRECRSRRGSWSSARRASARSPGSSPPFSAGSGAMRLHGRAVDQDVSRCAGRRRQSMEEPLPDALRGPSDVSVVERLSRSVVGRGVDPTPARLQDMDDAADHAAIIDSRLSAGFTRQMRRNPIELLVRQPETVAIHADLPSETVNHTSH